MALIIKRKYFSRVYISPPSKMSCDKNRLTISVRIKGKTDRNLMQNKAVLMLSIEIVITLLS